MRRELKGNKVNEKHRVDVLRLPNRACFEDPTVKSRISCSTLIDNKQVAEIRAFI
jgi:hypothetical protein